MRKSNFSYWLDNYKNYYDKDINIQDIDYVVWDRYGGWYITLEEKTGGSRGNERKKSQITVQDFITRALFRGSVKKKDHPSEYDPEYKGHFTIIFSNTTPDDSEWISINGHVYTDFSDFHYLMRYGELPQF